MPKIITLPQSFWQQIFRLPIALPFDPSKAVDCNPVVPEHCDVKLDSVIVDHQCEYHNVTLQIEGPHEFRPGAFDFLKVQGI